MGPGPMCVPINSLYARGKWELEGTLNQVSGSTCESSGHARLLVSFCLPVPSITYHVFYYAFAEHVSNIGKSADQHEEVND